MPDVSWSVVVTLIGMIFAAGVTWGVMRTKQSAQDEKTKSSDNKIDEILVDLKQIVAELRILTTELQVMKASHVRNERDIENHERRIAALEIAFAKLQDRV